MKKMSMSTIFSIFQPPKSKKVKAKKPPTAPFSTKSAPKKNSNVLIEKRPRNFGIGEYVYLSNQVISIDIKYGLLTLMIISFQLKFICESHFMAGILFLVKGAVVQWSWTSIATQAIAQGDSLGK